MVIGVMMTGRLTALAAPLSLQAPLRKGPGLCSWWTCGTQTLRLPSVKPSISSLLQDDDVTALAWQAIGVDGGHNRLVLHQSLHFCMYACVRA